MEAATVLSIVERQLLWVLEMYAFAESVQASKLAQHQQEGSVGSDVDSSSRAGGGKDGAGSDDEEENPLTPKRCSERSVKVMNAYTLSSLITSSAIIGVIINCDELVQALVTYEASRRAFVENERREALVQMRCSAISEVMYEIRDTIDWRSGRLRAALANGERHAAAESRYDAAASPADMLNAALRSICYKLLHVRRRL
jgi:hypothetical protein